MTAFAIGRLHSRRSLTLLLGGIASIAMISFLLRGIDVNDFLSVLAVADVRVLMLVPIAIAGEQLVRAWKWRQVLYPMRPSGTLGLFGAIVLGNLAGLLIPLGTSPIVRAWLVARREGLKTGSVLATVAVDRFIDGIVFIGLIPIALMLAPVRDPTHTLITLSWGSYRPPRLPLAASFTQLPLGTEWSCRLGGPTFRPSSASICRSGTKAGPILR